ncbi:S8 family serine peptidase [Luteimonas sp. M1R5S18]|uniref:S8 family serine peptidase n=1 Tax=Luteimonas rhizosphaericola TaxID=3042024 RepID=A0ABT6JF22_9GAMM|nr:autotransporter serine protease [Luteimonas rhizosphaericola]MDH5829280.1 S8 family serine peptidase [Luteimonas rhizosphaericola]
MSKQGGGTVSRLTMALWIGLALGACGGGGGATRPDPPPLAPPPIPPPETPPPGPPVVETPNPDFSDHLTLTGADAAQDAGWTGAGIRIGVIDSGVNRDHPALAGRVVDNLTYIDPNTNDLSVDDVVGHGTAVAQIIAGQAFGQWPGGVAPGAEIVSARIISDQPPEDDGSGEGNEVDGALGLAPIHDDLIARDVRIMNNSWGGLYWTNPAATAEIAAEYRPFILDNDGLVVFSTGNSGFADPSDMSALPSQAGTGGNRPAADLERGWLAVAALDAESPTQLAGYSNACGVAMDYCLAAPGTVVVTGTDDPPDEPEYWQWSGTSFAAPIVSGAAALVWEAFPYFDNDLVRQTLLGTATDLGAPGVDAVFGHGAVDVEAAVRGPARLDWGDVTVDFDGATSVWSNDISGQGALIKEGTGTLVVDANMSNTGGVRVRGGTLRAERTVRGDVRVDAAGTYAIGANVLDVSLVGNLDNAGRLDVIGQGVNREFTSIDGDYFHRDDATLAFDLGQVLGVGGTVRIEGGNLHVKGVKPGYTVVDRELVIEAGTLTGEFEALSWASSLFLEASLDYRPTQLWLDIERLDVAAAAKSLARIRPAGMSAAQRVEAAFDAIDAHDASGRSSAVDDEFRRVAGAFQHLGDEATAVAALDSLSGESHALATTLTFDAADMGRRVLSARLGALQPGLVEAGAWTQSLSSGGAGVGMAGGGFQLDGWMLGRDLALGDGLLAGFAFGETRVDDWVGGNRDRSRDRQTRAALYVGRVSAHGYALATAGTGRFDRDIERQLFTGEDARAGVSSGYAGDVATVGVEAGRQLHLGGWQLTPYVGADMVRVSQDGFEEWGSGYALRTRAASLQRTQATAGLRAGFDWAGARLHAYSAWQQTLSASGFDIDASFVGLDSWSPLPLADAARSGRLFGLGLEAPVGRHAWLSLGLDQRFGPRGDERMGSVRYTLGF